jgi:PiT family inorganic phosphate transporter
MGAGLSAAGLAAIKWSAIELIVVFMVVSPLIGLACGFLFMVVVLNLTKNTNKSMADGYFRRLQLVSAAAYSFSHGTNDAQKTIGIILPLLYSIGFYSATVDPNQLPVPTWVILISYGSIALGTLSGGWRIVKTMGYKITRLRPVHGFAAETAGAVTILSASGLGIPVSTTHIISTSIMGVGSTMGASTVKWGVARTIAIAWILTIPAAGLIGFFSFAIIRVVIGY